MYDGAGIQVAILGKGGATMSSQETLELLLTGLAVRRMNAPRPPWWGKLLRKFLAKAFWAVGHTVFDVKVRGLEHVENEPGTVVVSNHKSDWDIILLSPALYRAARGEGPFGNLSFVAAERMFEPGYFSTDLIKRPLWLSRALHQVNLSAVLNALHAYPIPQAHVRKLRAYLWDLLEMEGNLPLEQVVRPAPQRLLPGLPVGARIKDALRWRYRRELDLEYDFSIFPPTLERQLRERHIHRALACLGRFAAVLDEGDAVFFAPEGGLSLDGAFKEIKAGLHRVVRSARRPVTLLPVNLTYDLMTLGRQRVFLSIGPPLRGIAEREALKSETKQAIMSLSTATLGQLASHALQTLASQGRDAVEAHALTAQLQAQARELAGRGVHVDGRLLESRPFLYRWQAFVAYCEREGLLKNEGEWLRFDPRRVLNETGDNRRRAPSWIYSANEFDALIQSSSAA